MEVPIKLSGRPTDPSRMYRCYHCGDLHFSSDQARACASCGWEWLTGAIEEAQRQARRGPVPWWYKMKVRALQPWTATERMLSRALKRALPGVRVRGQWWIPGLDYRVDFLLDEQRLVVEVDGQSHRGREGADRLRSMDIRSAGYQVARVTADDVKRDTDRISAQIAFRVGVAENDDSAVPANEPVVASAPMPSVVPPV